MALAGLDYYAFGSDPAVVRAARFMREHGPQVVSYLGQISDDTLALRRLRQASRAKANARVHGTAGERAATSAAFAQATRNRAAEVRAQYERDAAPSGFQSMLLNLQQTLGRAGLLAALALAGIVIVPAMFRSRGNRS